MILFESLGNAVFISFEHLWQFDRLIVSMFKVSKRLFSRHLGHLLETGMLSFLCKSNSPLVILKPDPHSEHPIISLSMSSFDSKILSGKSLPDIVAVCELLIISCHLKPADNASSFVFLVSAQSISKYSIQTSTSKEKNSTFFFCSTIFFNSA